MKAFPRPIPSAGEAYNKEQSGMDLRDYFAAKAMQGIISSMSSKDIYQAIFNGAERADVCELTFIAGMSYEYANAMMEARNDGGNQ